MVLGIFIFTKSDFLSGPDNMGAGADVLGSSFFASVLIPFRSDLEAVTPLVIGALCSCPLSFDVFFDLSLSELFSDGAARSKDSLLRLELFSSPRNLVIFAVSAAGNVGEVIEGRLCFGRPRLGRDNRGGRLNVGASSVEESLDEDVDTSAEVRTFLAGAELDSTTSFFGSVGSVMASALLDYISLERIAPR